MRVLARDWKWMDFWGTHLTHTFQDLLIAGSDTFKGNRSTWDLNQRWTTTTYLTILQPAPKKPERQQGISRRRLKTICSRLTNRIFRRQRRAMSEIRLILAKFSMSLRCTRHGVASRLRNRMRCRPLTSKLALRMAGI